MTIDPRVGFWMSVALAIIGAVAGGASQITAIFGQHSAEVILACSVLLLTIGNAVNAVLHAIPSKSTGLNDFYLGSGKPEK
jgi:phage-related protein